MERIFKWILIIFIPLCGICVPVFYFIILDAPTWVFVLELFFIPTGIMWVIGHYDDYFK